MVQFRIRNIAVRVHDDLTVHFEMGLSIKPHHLHLFEKCWHRVRAWQNKKGTMCYRYVYSSMDRIDLLEHMTTIQFVINEEKSKDLNKVRDQLIDRKVALMEQKKHKS